MMKRHSLDIMYIINYLEIHRYLYTTNVLWQEELPRLTINRDRNFKHQFNFFKIILYSYATKNATNKVHANNLKPFIRS